MNYEYENEIGLLLLLKHEAAQDIQFFFSVDFWVQVAD